MTEKLPQDLQTDKDILFLYILLKLELIYFQLRYNIKVTVSKFSRNTNICDVTDLLKLSICFTHISNVLKIWD